MTNPPSGSSHDWIRVSNWRQFIMCSNISTGTLRSKRPIAFGAPGGELRRRARAQPLDAGANDDVRQRHPFGSADDRGNEAHVTTSFCGGIGKNTLVRDRYSR